MTPSVSPEAEWELTEESVYYAREGGAELAEAFITEFERVLALLCQYPRLGAEWRNRRRGFSLPVEEISKLRLVVDLRTARKLGITIPSSILARADALLAHMASITEYRPVASVVWNIAGSSGWRDAGGTEQFDFHGSHWSVGFSDAARFPECAVVEIDGVPFVLDAVSQSARLVGAVLDYVNGQYVVHEPPAA